MEAGTAADALLEELIKVYSASPTFRQTFQSQTTTQVFLDAFRSFVSIVSTSNELHNTLIRVLEKLSHLALTISLDNVVSTGQKQEVCCHFYRNWSETEYFFRLLRYFKLPSLCLILILTILTWILA